MKQTLVQLKRDLQRQASPAKAKASTWFFKTEPGQYGDHEKFLGVTVPAQRAIAKKYRDLPLPDVMTLLRSPYHEHRLTAVFLLTDQFRRGGSSFRKKIFATYLKHTQHINNWDIVDSSAPHIVGMYLLDHPRTILYRFAQSKDLWERRISIIATQTFIRHGQFSDTLKIAKLLLRDEHDLIHKAVGWMLREVGDRDHAAEVKFLGQHAKHMPRTMLRYAVEKFPEAERRRWLLA